MCCSAHYLYVCTGSKLLPNKQRVGAIRITHGLRCVCLSKFSNSFPCTSLRSAKCRVNSSRLTVPTVLAASGFRLSGVCQAKRDFTLFIEIRFCLVNRLKLWRVCQYSLMFLKWPVARILTQCLLRGDWSSTSRCSRVKFGPFFRVFVCLATGWSLIRGLTPTCRNQWLSQNWHLVGTH